MRNIVLAVALITFSGCGTSVGSGECTLDCNTERVLVDIETVCETQDVEISDTVCITVTTLETEMVCETEIICDTGVYSYVDTNCSTSGVDYGGTICSDGSFQYPETTCRDSEVGYSSSVSGVSDYDYVEATCDVTEYSFEPVDSRSCPDEINRRHDGNTYEYCIQFDDGFSECGFSTSSNKTIHGMSVHLSCSATYDDQGYPDVGEPVRSNGDPGVLNLSVAKWRVRSGCCSLRNECEESLHGECDTVECYDVDVTAEVDVELDYNYTCDETTCTDSVVHDSVNVCNDWSNTCQETTCIDSVVSGFVEVCIDDEDCFENTVEIQEDFCEDVTMTKEVKVCWEVETYENVTTCDETSCDNDEEWVQGGGTLGE